MISKVQIHAFKNRNTNMNSPHDMLGSVQIFTAQKLKLQDKAVVVLKIKGEKQAFVKYLKSQI